MGLFSGLKDNFTNISARLFLQKIIKNYGELVHLHIDSSERIISIEIKLLGEKETLNIKISKYEITHDVPARIKIANIETNREWLNKLAADHFSGKEFSIPEKYSLIIKLLL